jgi:frataxin-like iron-binding protein CyaY
VDEQEFRLAADRAIDDLHRRLVPLVDEGRCDVETGGGALHVVFEAPRPETFVVTPNVPTRQIWVSAMSRSYKLPWVQDDGAFIYEGETLARLVDRLAHAHLGNR